MSDENNNLALWDEVCGTNPDHTKLVTIGQRSYTTITPMSQAKVATEQFGLYGVGWGLENSKFDWQLKDEGLVLHSAAFFFTVQGKKESFLIHNSAIWKTIYKEGNSRIDADFAKKLETNTISKALSKLGFNADVFMGQFDDHDYVNEQRLKAGLEAIDAPEGDVRSEKIKEFYQWCENQINSYEMINNPTALTSAYGAHMKTAKGKAAILKLDWAEIGQKFQDGQRAQLEKINEAKAAFEAKNKNKES